VIVNEANSRKGGGVGPWKAEPFSNPGHRATADKKLHGNTASFCLGKEDSKKNEGEGGPGRGLQRHRHEGRVQNPP